MTNSRVAAVVALTAITTCLLSGCGSGSTPTGPVLSLPATSSSPARPHTLADKRAVQRWLRHGKQTIATIVAAETKAVSAAKRNDPYAEVTICQPLQLDLERAQEANGIPDKALNSDYQRAMATLARGTTHCLNDAHSSDEPDRLATIKIGKVGIAQFAVLARALRPYR